MAQGIRSYRAFLHFSALRTCYDATVFFFTVSCAYICLCSIHLSLHFWVVHCRFSLLLKGVRALLFFIMEGAFFSRSTLFFWGEFSVSFLYMLPPYLHGSLHLSLSEIACLRFPGIWKGQYQCAPLNRGHSILPNFSLVFQSCFDEIQPL